MIQLICNGEYLDLEGSAKLSFQKSNPLFAFDSLKCERTTEFSLPDTPKNNMVFALAKNPAFYGDGMRRKFDAQLIIGVCVKNGYLYVSNYSKGAYKAIFVTGELLELQRIRELGKLKDIIVNDETAQYGGDVITPSSALSTIWDNVDHLAESGIVNPNSLVRLLSERVTTQNNLRAVALPSAADGLRVIPSKVNSLTSEGMSFETTAHPNRYSTTQPGVVYDTYIEGERWNGLRNFFRYANEITRDYSLGTGNPRSGYVIFIQPLIDMIVTFPEDFPSNVFAVSSVAAGYAEFLGGYSFDIINRQIVRTGEPLAGREIVVKAGTSFLLVDERDRTKVEDYYGWYFTHSLSLHLDVRAEHGDAEVGDVVRLQDNLPDITYIELLKTIAAISGKALNYTDADGITFEDVDMSAWNRVDITPNLVSIDNISRKFGDYAQANVIRFDGETSQVTRAYMVDNDNLAASKDLQVIPFSEGIAQYDDQGNCLVSVVAEGKKDTIAQSGSAPKLMQVELGLNNGIQSLCTSSTSVEVKVKMSLFEYESLSAKTTILCQGTLYVWTDAKWSDGIAEFTLAKI